jgi:sugar O-acyltransferase (sialic acid O-acetyltransferase NeuD family)
MKQRLHSSSPESFSGLLVLGFGGHARAAADVALSAGVTDLLFWDENAREGENFRGFPVVSSLVKGLLKQGWAAFPASGNGKRRAEMQSLIDSLGWETATLTSPRASIGVGCVIGRGCFIGHLAHIGPLAQIGDGCIVNSGAVVEHECSIGAYTHISVNSTVAGRCKVGGFVMVGAGATVIDGIEINDEIVVGAGGVVKDNLDKKGTYVGVPAYCIDQKAG